MGQSVKRIQSGFTSYIDSSMLFPAAFFIWLLRVLCMKYMKWMHNEDAMSTHPSPHSTYEITEQILVKIMSHVRVTLDGILDWILDLLATLTHDSWLHLIMAPSLISTLLTSTILTLSNHMQGKTYSVPCGVQWRCCNNVMSCLTTLCHLHALVHLNEFGTSQIQNTGVSVGDGRRGIFAVVSRHSWVRKTQRMRL
jgi:hypothetical protein